LSQRITYSCGDSLPCWLWSYRSLEWPWGHFQQDSCHISQACCAFSQTRMLNPKTTYNSVKLIQTKRVINIITQPGQQGKGSHVYLCHILSMHPPICLGPFYFTRVPLHFKVLVALRSTESKNLQQEQLWDTVTTHSLWSGAMNKHTHKTKPLIVIGITLPVTYYKVK
jgi:hypothetical protein